MPQSTQSPPGKPAKPRPDFPLYAHATGKWAKTIRGKTHYFGSWDDPYSAESEYLEVAEDLHAGRIPRHEGGPTLRDICNAFIRSKKTKMDADNLSPRTFVDYHETCKWLLEEFGANRSVTDIRPSDFEELHAKLSARHSLSIIGGTITMVRSVFKYAYEMDLIEKPVKYGPSFRAPTASERRKHKAKQQHQNGSRVFQAHEIRQMLGAALPQLKAMFLLGINGGMGNTDCSRCPSRHLISRTGGSTILDRRRVLTDEFRSGQRRSRPFKRSSNEERTPASRRRGHPVSDQIPASLASVCDQRIDQARQENH